MESALCTSEQNKGKEQGSPLLLLGYKKMHAFSSLLSILTIENQ